MDFSPINRGGVEQFTDRLEARVLGKTLLKGTLHRTRA